MKHAALIWVVSILAATVSAEEYHVAKTGNDENEGSLIAPFRTIQAAANIAQPGDIITVHEGIYRERVNPLRGGTSDDRRIVYRAGEGETAEIRGSEIIDYWVSFSGTVWKATISNALFGDYNPYVDIIQGDWFNDMGRLHHTGEVYLNGKSLWEMELLEKVLHPEPAGEDRDSEGSLYTWYCESDNYHTYIYANFHQFDPNEEEVEINVRQTCFYPDSTGINFITIRGFHMSQAATQWAPPTAEQIGLIGTNWSKGWIIENNVIRNSKCSGITLGKYGDEFDNTSANSAKGYIETVQRALERGWNRENIGSHIIRNNVISECGQTGICGSMGGVFSIIENNDIHNIWTKRQFSGAEMGGIKIHASIDMLIKGNRVVNAGRGIWIDWMAQGTRVSSNICYHNILYDFYAEVNHGPYLVDNNLFLSLCSVWDMSQGGAYVHNLMAGRINMSPHSRVTPYHRPHSTEIAGYHELLSGDNSFYNNIFVGGCEVNKDQINPDYKSRLRYGEEYFGIKAYDNAAFPVRAGGNVYWKEAEPAKVDENILLEPDHDPQVRLGEEEGNLFLYISFSPALSGMNTNFITNSLLGKSIVSGQPYENPDGSPYQIDTDYLGKKRNIRNPAPGPFESAGSGLQKIKVWD